ncbi:MAG: glyoxalase [Clostridia bacterium]
MPTMVRFYRDVLGFEIKEEESEEYVYLVKDGTLFLLYRRSDLEQMTAKSFAYANGVNGHYEIALRAKNYAAVDDAFKNVIFKDEVPVLAPTAEPWEQRTC